MLSRAFSAPEVIWRADDPWARASGIRQADGLETAHDRGHQCGLPRFCSTRRREPHTWRARAGIIGSLLGGAFLEPITVLDLLQRGRAEHNSPVRTDGEQSLTVGQEGQLRSRHLEQENFLARGRIEEFGAIGRARSQTSSVS